MIAEQIIIDAYILNEYIKENRLTLREYSVILNYYYSKIASFPFQNTPRYLNRLTKKFNYYDKFQRDTKPSRTA
jgi:hypothetical protein